MCNVLDERSLRGASDILKIVLIGFWFEKLRFYCVKTGMVELVWFG